MPQKGQAPAKSFRQKRLVVVSNREPFVLSEKGPKATLEKTVGGLTAALIPAMKKQGGLWISASKEKEGKRIRALLQADKKRDFDWEPVFLKKSLENGFYAQFSNRILWPLYHSMLGNMMVPNEKDFSDFKEANQSFERVINENIRAQDFIWIHDFHLSLVPQMLRSKADKTIRIGFFLHIPFPCFELFRTLPWRVEILEGMLGADLIGFHTKDYTRYFLDAVKAILQVSVDDEAGIIHYQKRQIKVQAFPISIDTAHFHRESAKKQLKSAAISLKKHVGASKLVIGVDRLDYTKGISKRLLALETFFKRYPEYIGKLSMLQLAVPSRSDIRTYQILRQEIERQVGHINGLLGRPGWTPVTYMCRNMPFEELLALYQAADIALVTPLRDGMNLVAKEFVASHHKMDGVLVLSELAGAAAELNQALLVNPYDVEGIAESLHAALTMPQIEQKRRMREMNALLAEQDVFAFVNHFLQAGESL